MMPKVFGDEHATNVAKQEATSDSVHQRHLIIHDAKRRPHYPDEDSANRWRRDTACWNEENVW